LCVDFVVQKAQFLSSHFIINENWLRKREHWVERTKHAHVELPKYPLIYRNTRRNIYIWIVLYISLQTTKTKSCVYSTRSNF
jgi:hypothetical protein